ncbi:MAG TPA: ABC transporter substrate-binding protein [Salinimicrobium sp.]|nr:ABC transporter substrate-binding protein [Salinimicrobium sp.]
MKKILLLLVSLAFFGCNNQDKLSAEPELTGTELEIKYAKGFSIIDYGSFKILNVESPFPESKKSYKYLLVQKEAQIPENLEYDQKIEIPVQKIVVTSTTHIPSLETLQVEESLVGFPNLSYISSEKTRKLIAEGKVTELGQNESINTEVLISLQPDVVVGFEVDGNNKTFNTIKKSGIPVVYNADWTENSPLGKAEWIKFFGVFYNKSDEAFSAFEDVEKTYLEAKKRAATATTSPTVLSGSMYKDIWYLPGGKSWQAQFIKDANADYLYADSEETGSLNLSIENVLSKAQNAEFWIGPAQFTSYEQMLNESQHYQQFESFQNKKIYTYSSKKGETGGVIYYELAPNRPDLVLKDLISIFHPELFPQHKLVFFEPLD